MSRFSLPTPGPRFLTVYSALLTAVFAFTVFAGAAPSKKSRFEEIDVDQINVDQINVKRINVVEPDGTLRMTISGRQRLPGLIVHGKETPFERPQAGMLFFNDEASEIGGLIFGGRKNEKGEIVDAGGALSFDRFEGNQIVQLIGVDEKETKIAGLLVTDSPEKAEPQRRLFAGKGSDGASRIALSDAQGRKRVVIEVQPDGAARLAFLDADGKVVRELTPVAPGTP
jgi:hypothetical protein